MSVRRASARRASVAAPGAVLLTATALAALAAGAGAQLPARIASAGARFTLSGPVSGTLVAPASDCGASRSAPDIQFSLYGGVKSLKTVSTRSIVTIEVDLAGSRYGRSGTLSKTLGKAPFVSFGATNPNPLKEPSNWQSVSGTFSTSAQGAGGSIDALLHSTLGRNLGQLTLRGSWSGCPAAAGT
jgi:hypothetical protein